jgi:hypothetical protein
MQCMKYVRHVPAALTLAWALLPASAGATGIVLTGGALTLDFADPAIGGNSTTLDRMDSLTWSGGSGAIAGENLVSNAGPSSCNGDPIEFFGQSYGEPEGTYPLIVNAGDTATVSNQTKTSMTSTTTGVVTCSCGNSTSGNIPATTTYNVFPAGDPNVNEIRISRTIEFSATTPIYSGTHGVRGYVARLPIGTYGTVLYPNAAGTAINTASAAACPGDCEESDWNGQWFADDNGSGTGMVVFRDSSSTSPVLLAVNYDQASNSNLTSIVLLQPGAGWKAPVTETEWLCFYDPTTWTAAQRLAGTLPTGCAQHALASTPAESSIVFAPVLSAMPGTAATSNTVQLTGIGAGTPISITGGEYSINGGAYTSAAGTVNNGDYLTVQVTASANYCDTTSASITIGGVTTQFSVTTPASGFTSLFLGINPHTVSLGQPAVLTWSTANATSCTADGAWSGTESTSGNFTVSPTSVGLQTYTLTCTGMSTATATVDLVVIAAAPLAPTVTLTANPTSIVVNHATNLTWSSTNATNCTDSGAWGGGYAVSGSASEFASTPGTLTYTITCTGPGGSATATATVTVTAAVTPAPTVTLAVNPTSVTVGEAATLTWSSTNATACTASGAWSGTEAASGTASETPTAAGSQVFTLTCTGAGGSAHASATLTATAPPAPTVTLAANPNSVTLGSSATLTWSSTNATACTASGGWSGSEAVSGSLSETPTSAGETIFTLTCTGAGGSANASAALVATALTVVGGSASGRIGGGGALDLTSLAGLVVLAGLARRAKRRVAVNDDAETAPRRSARCFVIAACGCALLTAALPSRAADEFGFDWQHSYVGLRAGESLYQPTTSYLLNSLGPNAAEIQSLSIDSHQFGGVVYAGVPLWRSLSLEIGYAQIGQFPLSMTTAGSGGGLLNAKAVARPAATVRALAGGDIDGLAQAVVNAAPAAGHGVTLGFAMPIDITSWLNIEPRFAALGYQSKQTLSTSDATLRHDSTGAGFDAGLAFSVRAGGPIYLGAGVDCFHEDRGCNTLLISAQFEYRFGHRGER